MNRIILALILGFWLSPAHARSGDVYENRLGQLEKELSQMLPDSEPGVSVIITHGNRINIR